MSAIVEPDAQFSEHRSLLFSIAYEILGSVSDAEDAVQESYLRWRSSDHDAIQNPRAYMAQIVARQALMMLRAASRRREEYIGPWLPEPIATAGPSDDGPSHVLSGEAASMAMLLVLETLNPEQRAVFVLREVFEFSYGEIAAAVGKSEAAVRQINSRARKHVNDRRGMALASPSDVSATVEKIVVAVSSGDIEQVMALLAPDVVAISDGGGVVSAAKVPVHGREKVARFLLGVVKLGERQGEVTYRYGIYNGMPALLSLIDGRLDTVTCIEIHDDLITAGYSVRNPEKLRSVRLPELG
jgi:RNA polymerase sigma-70 factor, ECF subfamily